VSERVDWFALIAKERGMPDGWMWNSSRVLEGSEGFLISGAVCTTRFTSGPRKGRLNWAKRDRATEREIFISRADIEARQAQWECETGKCRKCFGSTQEWAGWSAKDGTIFKPCRSCDSTGVAPTSPPPSE
jgi:hypothetical protein